MSRAPFRERLAESAATRGSFLCVGLDPDPEQIPPSLGAGISAVRRHTLAVIEATAPYAAAYKPNAAFFEQFGAPGWELLIEVVGVARQHAPVILDAKRGDIGSTAAAYARAVFDVIGADACTVNPYLGGDSLEPFLSRPDRFTFILCRTSNPGARDLQDLLIEGRGGEPLYLAVGRCAVEWNVAGNVGLVAGATWAAEISRLRTVAPDMPILLPGIGRQGGDLREAILAARGPSGRGEYLASASRGISQASTGDDFAEAAGAAARDLAGQLRQLAQIQVSPEEPVPPTQE
ncbi:MAG TPA: orotidine-5'-phosphate decarboxylase [Candidatus Dormibacteraeota bacterium]